MEFVKAFLIGGLLCVIGQLLIDFTKLTPARILVSYVTAGVVLTAVGVYQPLVCRGRRHGPSDGVWLYPGDGCAAGGGGNRLAGHFYRRLYSRGGRGGRGGAVRLFGGALLPVGG